MTTRTLSEHSLLAAVLDAWDRNNTVLVNLLRCVPPGGLEARATATSPTVSQMFMHMHHERMISVEEEAPEIGAKAPPQEWAVELNAERIAECLFASAQCVREAVRRRVEAGRDLDRDYAHPIHLIHLLTFHEGYHHGQIKLALKIAGTPIPDNIAGSVTWHVWRSRKPISSPQA
ncbi:DinB family protein [Oleiharenicola lentus]|uniref:DinB family protein n=1 Tax=Oleiharenicola lentus TaxID=2508720 RepID=UPI003F6630F6